MIREIHLIYFRNHINFKAEFDSNLVIISGENGSGKTNILEAISLLAPGRSFRNCKLGEIINNQDIGVNEWGAHISLEEIKFSTGYTHNSLRKIKKNGELLKSQVDILQDIKVLWLLPQMENIFLGPASARRKFFDRICYNIFPQHAKNVLRYEYYTRARLKILQCDHFDVDWLDLIELNLAKLSIAIQEMRENVLCILIEKLNTISSKFLKPKLELTNLITILEEKSLQNLFKNYRMLDKRSNRSNFGPHKTDLIITDHMKKQKAEYCSTGEQKALLVSFFIAQALAIKNISGIAPIMLMDEILAHFDLVKQMNILKELKNLSSQIWITTTINKADFLKLFGENQFSWLDL